MYCIQIYYAYIREYSKMVNLWSLYTNVIWLKKMDFWKEDDNQIPRYFFYELTRWKGLGAHQGFTNIFSLIWPEMLDAKKNPYIWVSKLTSILEGFLCKAKTNGENVIWSHMQKREFYNLFKTPPPSQAHGARHGDHRVRIYGVHPNTDVLLN